MTVHTSINSHKYDNNPANNTQEASCTFDEASCTVGLNPVYITGGWWRVAPRRDAPPDWPNVINLYIGDSRKQSALALQPNCTWYLHGVHCLLVAAHCLRPGA